MYKNKHEIQSVRFIAQKVAIAHFQLFVLLQSLQVTNVVSAETDYPTKVCKDYHFFVEWFFS